MSLEPPDLRPLDRRTFLRRAGAVGGLGAIAIGFPGLLSACGSSSKGSTVDQLSLTDDLGGRQLVGLFNYSGDYLVSQTPQRMAFAITSPDGPPTTDGPETLSLQVTREGGAEVEPVVLERHTDGVPIGYYPLTTTFDQPGTWTVSGELDGRTVSQAFAVQDPATVSILQPGTPMASVDTPTTSDTRGINPICTRVPACPLHERGLADVLADGAPVALMISTPQYCQTGVCGPVLDLVLEQVAEFPDIRFVHAEVYKDPNGGSTPSTNGLAPVIDAYGLSFEPSLFVAHPNGLISSRLDNIFDRVELRQALQTAVA